MKFYFTILLLFCAQLNAKEIEQYEVAAKLEKSRSNLSPKTGSTVHQFNQDDIKNMPLGEATSINQVLLRSAGVVQDSFSQIRIRGDHSNIQYRINGVIIPKGIGSFGQMVDARFIDNVELLTGAMPAQYGYRTGGVVEIKTKDGAMKQGGRSEAIVGGFNTLGASQELSGSKDGLNYYLNASYLQNSRGIETPQAGRASLHNDTKQDKIFSYFSKLLDAQTKISFIFANATNRFQLPNNPNQQAEYELDGHDNVVSSSLNQNQKEENRYAIVALQGVSESEIDYQISAFVRQSKLIYRGDKVGNLIFNGTASDIDRSTVATGLQGDFSYKINEKNILRSGFTASDEFVKNSAHNSVFSVDANGDQDSTTPFVLSDKSQKHAQNYSIYLQNEYKPIKKLTINYGARFDAVQSYKNESQLSPRLGLVYDLTAQTKMHFGYARYFTPPQNELISSKTLAQYQDTTNAPNSLNNDAVRSQRSNYYDAGIAHKINANLNISFDAYYQEVKNLLDEGQFGQALVYAPLNYEDGKVYGLEFSTNYHKDNFSSYFNISTQRAKARGAASSQHFLDDEEIATINSRYINVDHDQKVSASAGAAYKYKNTNYILDAIYGSGLSKDFTKHLPSYFVLNGAVEKKFVMPFEFNLRLSAINLLDRNYKLRDGSGVGVGAPQYGQRRTFYLIFSKEF